MTQKKQKELKRVIRHCSKTGERAGQLIWNAMNAEGYWESPEANALFFISDKDLWETIIKYI
jgi:hypothetical protein